MFRELPIEYVSVDNLAKVAKGGGEICSNTSQRILFFLPIVLNDFLILVTNKVYGCVVDMADNLVRKSDGGFDQQEYFSHPELYASNFARKVALERNFIMLICVYRCSTLIFIETLQTDCTFHFLSHQLHLLGAWSSALHHDSRCQNTPPTGSHAMVAKQQRMSAPAAPDGGGLRHFR